MRHTLPLAPQFYVTAPQPCPYLAGRMERKLFTALQGDQSEALNDSLSKQGFRRSQNVLYRPSCADCAACLSARIDVGAFRPSRSQRKTIRANRGLRRRAISPWANEEQYDLFRAYLDGRHADGGMADMDMFEFAAMVEETPIRTRLVEYREPVNGEVELRAVGLTDLLDDGVSMVYSFFDPDIARRSPGTYMILDHIAIARELGLAVRLSRLLGAGQPKDGLQGRLRGARDLSPRPVGEASGPAELPPRDPPAVRGPDRRAGGQDQPPRRSPRRPLDGARHGLSGTSRPCARGQPDSRFGTIVTIAGNSARISSAHDLDQHERHDPAIDVPGRDLRAARRRAGRTARSRRAASGTRSAGSPRS